MKGSRILERYNLIVGAGKEERIFFIKELLEDGTNEFEVKFSGSGIHHLTFNKNTLCNLSKKEDDKKIDERKLIFTEHELKNNRGETLVVSFAKARLNPRSPENPTGENATVLIFKDFSKNNLSFETNSSAAYSTGDNVSHFLSKEEIFYLTDGDRKRINSYPIFIYLNNDKTKNSRFQLRNI